MHCLHLKCSRSNLVKTRTFNLKLRPNDHFKFEPATRNLVQHLATCRNRVAKRTQHVAPEKVAIYVALKYYDCLGGPQKDIIAATLFLYWILLTRNNILVSRSKSDTANHVISDAYLCLLCIDVSTRMGLLGKSICDIRTAANESNLRLQNRCEYSWHKLFTAGSS